jgi:hypothetical protein
MTYGQLGVTYLRMQLYQQAIENFEVSKLGVNLEVFGVESEVEEDTDRVG